MILADVPEGSTVWVRAKVRRYKDHEQSFTDLMVEHVNGYRDSGPGTARLFQHRNVEVAPVQECVACGHAVEPGEGCPHYGWQHAKCCAMTQAPPDLRERVVALIEKCETYQALGYASDAEAGAYANGKECGVGLVSEWLREVLDAT